MWLQFTGSESREFLRETLPDVLVGCVGLEVMPFEVRGLMGGFIGGWVD